MSRFLKSLILSAPLILATPMLANALGFESNISTPTTSPIKINISLSEDLAYRSNNIPQDLQDQGNGVGGRISNGFSSNGFYGDKDLAKLEKRIEKSLTRQFKKRGLTISDSAPTTLTVTLVDVKNNRPTRDQLTNVSRLALQSVGTGGAEIDAELVSAGGVSLGKMHYEFFENNLSFSRSEGTWTDTNRAIDWFAERAAKRLAEGA